MAFLGHMLSASGRAAADPTPTSAPTPHVTAALPPPHTHTHPQVRVAVVGGGTGEVLQQGGLQVAYTSSKASAIPGLAYPRLPTVSGAPSRQLPGTVMSLAVASCRVVRKPLPCGPTRPAPPPPPARPRAGPGHHPGWRAAKGPRRHQHGAVPRLRQGQHRPAVQLGGQRLCGGAPQHIQHGRQAAGPAAAAAGAAGRCLHTC